MNTPHIRDYKGKKIHMIGIGGSSMSGLAQMLIAQGYTVTGSDRTDGYLMGDVRAAGAQVMIGHRAENVHGAELVAFTAAVPADTPDEVVAEMSAIAKKVVEDPDFIEKCNTLSIVARYRNVEEVNEFVQSENTRFENLIKSKGFGDRYGK